MERKEMRYEPREGFAEFVNALERVSDRLLEVTEILNQQNKDIDRVLEGMLVEVEV